MIWSEVYAAMALAAERTGLIGARHSSFR